MSLIVTLNLYADKENLDRSDSSLYTEFDSPTVKLVGYNYKVSKIGVKSNMLICKGGCCLLSTCFKMLP